MFQQIQNLRTFFATGQTFDIEWRKNQLKAVIRMLEEQTPSIEKALFDDLHKSAEEAWLTEIGFVLHEARFVLKNIEKWTAEKRVTTPVFLAPATSVIRPQPRGHVLIISPWNYPIQLTISPLIAALAAGNVVTIKPSELAPNTSKWCVENLPRYLDKRAISVVEAGPERTEELLKKRFDFIFFTGSARIAKHVARAAAEHLTPTVLELGGKSPCVVTHCHHLETAAKRIVFAKFINAGQTCVAPDYVLVEEELRPKLISALKNAVFEQFGPENAPTSMTHIIHQRHFERLDGLLGNGEMIVHGGARSVGDLSFSPTLVECDASHPLMEEEIFGPILPVLTLESDEPTEEALRFIAKHPTPLACYLFSDNKNDVKAFKHLICGGFAHNDALMHLSNVHLPFGGVGRSGHGASHGYAGFEAFSHMRSELHQSSVVDVPLRYPPFTERVMKLIKMAMK